MIHDLRAAKDVQRGRISRGLFERAPFALLVYFGSTTICLG